MTYPPNDPAYGGGMPPQQPGGYPQQGPPADPKNGMGTTSLVLGIIGVAGGLFIPCIGWILGILATVFGGVGVARANRGQATNKTIAVTGLALGIAAIVIGTLAAFIWSDINADIMSEYQ